MKQFCVRINFDMLVGYLPLSHRKAQVVLLPCGLHMEREEGEKLHELKNPGEWSKNCLVIKYYFSIF